jgi:hypothetical protein
LRFVVSEGVYKGSRILIFNPIKGVKSINLCFFIKNSNYAKVILLLLCLLAVVVTSARFIAQSALVKWSQLRLFKAKERRGYLQRISLYKYSGSAALHRLY